MFSSGQQIGYYTLIQKLGRGGFGEVWLAEKRTQFITKKVAVKLPFDEKISFQSIQQEAMLWEQASGHPNVLPIIDADIYNGQVVIVSEFAEGGSLDDKLKNGGKLSIKSAVEMTIGILNGLEFLHSKQIIHRDIKPANVLLQGGTPRLADFGVSRVIQTTNHSSVIIGTDAYMSPEAFDGQRNIQTDIWSVGVLLYELLTGKLPFAQDHPTERMFAVLMKDFDSLPDEIPSPLQKIVASALAKKPEQRYQNAQQMRDDLQQFLMNLSQSTNSLERQISANQNQINVPITQSNSISLNTDYQNAANTSTSSQVSTANDRPIVTTPTKSYFGIKVLLITSVIGIFLIFGGIGLFFLGRFYLNSMAESNSGKTTQITNTKETTTPTPVETNDDTNDNPSSTERKMLSPDEATFKVIMAGDIEELVNVLNQSPIEFEKSSAKLTWESSSILVLASAKLKELPENKVIEISCHTDNQGSPEKNLALSKSRANSIRQTLIEFGINGKLLTAKGYGDSQPISSNDTEEGRKQNRRIEFKLSSN